MDPPTANTNAQGDDEDFDDLFSADLFLDEDYKMQIFRFGDTEQPLLCSQAASTDFDLTGLFADKIVVELGAGCGLTGLVASHFSTRTVLTDGNEVVLRLLQRNADLQLEAFADAKQQQQLTQQPRVQTAKLLWGDEAALQQFVEQYGAPDVLLGADVVCWPAFITPFLLTVKGLLQASKDPEEAALYLGYVCRATSTTEAFHSKAAAMGFVVEPLSMPHNRFAAADTDEDAELVHSELKLQAFKVTLDWSTDVARVPPNWPEPGSDVDDYTATPC